jgi:hypothetical protein
MEKSGEKKGFRAWLKRLGWAGFFFFLIKGILWLVLGKGLLEIFR